MKTSDAQNPDLVTPDEQRAALDRAKKGNKQWFGRLPIEPANDYRRSHQIVPVNGRVVRR